MFDILLQQHGLTPTPLPPTTQYLYQNCHSHQPHSQSYGTIINTENGTNFLYQYPLNYLSTNSSYSWKSEAAPIQPNGSWHNFANYIWSLLIPAPVPVVFDLDSFQTTFPQIQQLILVSRSFLKFSQSPKPTLGLILLNLMVSKERTYQITHDEDSEESRKQCKRKWCNLQQLLSCTYLGLCFNLYS